MIELRTSEITPLLNAGRGGDREAADKIWVAIYGELKELARHMRYEKGARRHGGPGTTTMVHEAYLRLLGMADVDWRDRNHFFAIAARAMRFVLVDQARRRLARKRDAEMVPEISEDVPDPGGQPPEEVLAVHQALERLAEVNPRHEKLVELHYFSGLTLEESAEVLGVSRRTVMRDWKAVRIWLHGELVEARA